MSNPVRFRFVHPKDRASLASLFAALFILAPISISIGLIHGNQIIGSSHGKYYIIIANAIAWVVFAVIFVREVRKSIRRRD